VGAAAKTPGFGAGEGADAGFSAAVRKHFRPEFFNRIDDVVPFGALALADIERIVDLALAEIATRQGFASRNIRIVARAEARARLAELGYDPEFGARPLKRVMESQVVTPLAVALSADTALRDVTFEVRAAGDGVEVARA
jgi:ATP-dependent Clp protease ATP-binding subunit ClpA